MIYTIEIYFLLFITYAIIGWIVEIVNEIVTTGKFVNRGFLIGPYCPIYGWGGLLITILLQKYSSDPIVLFLLSIIICSLLEYYTSYFMEKFFNARWWDYSDRKFNINGRICLETMIPFGLLGLLMIYGINPFIFKFYYSFSDGLLTVISSILFIIFLVDNIISFNVFGKIKNDIIKFDKDNTEEITNKVRDLIVSKSWLFRRIVSAFPEAVHISKIKDNVNKIITKGIAKQEKLKIETEEKIKKIKIESEFRIQKLKEKTNKRIEKINK